MLPSILERVLSRAGLAASDHGDDAEWLDRLIVECRTAEAVVHGQVLNRLEGVLGLLGQHADNLHLATRDARVSLAARLDALERTVSLLVVLLLIAAALLAVCACVHVRFMRLAHRSVQLIAHRVEDVDEQKRLEIADVRARVGAELADVRATLGKEGAKLVHGLADVRANVNGVRALAQASRIGVDHLVQEVLPFAEGARKDLENLRKQGAATEARVRAAGDAFADFVRFLEDVSQERAMEALEQARVVTALEEDTARVRTCLVEQARLEAQLSRALLEAVHENAKVHAQAASCKHASARLQGELLLLEQLPQ